MHLFRLNLTVRLKVNINYIYAIYMPKKSKKLFCSRSVYSLNCIENIYIIIHEISARKNLSS